MNGHNNKSLKEYKREKAAFFTTSASWIGAIVILMYLQLHHGNWLMSIGLALSWWLASELVGAKLFQYLKMDPESWNSLADRYPAQEKVTDDNAFTNASIGAFNETLVVFWLTATSDHVTIETRGVWFYRRKGITVPWCDVQLRRTWTDEDKELFASISFKGTPDCELVVPWRKHFLDALENAGADHIQTEGTLL